MKRKFLVIVVCSLFLSACNLTLPKKNAQTEVIGVGQYKLSLEKADAHYTKKNYNQALTAYLRLNEKAPKDTQVLFRIANIYTHLENPEQAIVFYKQALKQDITLSKAWYNLGVVRMKQTASTWSDMQKYVDHDDPLHKASGHFSRGMLDLINPEKP